MQRLEVRHEWTFACTLTTCVNVRLKSNMLFNWLGNSYLDPNPPLVLKRRAWWISLSDSGLFKDWLRKHFNTYLQSTDFCCALLCTCMLWFKCVFSWKINFYFPLFQIIVMNVRQRKRINLAKKFLYLKIKVKPQHIHLHQLVTWLSED